MQNTMCPVCGHKLTIVFTHVCIFTQTAQGAPVFENISHGIMGVFFFKNRNLGILSQVPYYLANSAAE